MPTQRRGHGTRDRFGGRRRGLGDRFGRRLAGFKDITTARADHSRTRPQVKDANLRMTARWAYGKKGHRGPPSRGGRRAHTLPDAPQACNDLLAADPATNVLAAVAEVVRLWKP